MGISAAFMVPHPPIILPDIGGGEEKKIKKTFDAYEEAAKRIAAHRPETIVLVSPHQVMYGDYFHISPGSGAKGDMGAFRAGNVKFQVAYDTEFVNQLCGLAAEEDIPAGTLGERDRKLDHGTMVPLWFVDRYWKNYKLVRIGLSGLSLDSHYALGQCIKRVSETLGRSAVLIGSGDLSHRLKEDGPYGFQEEGPVYDARIMDVMGRAAFGELFNFSENLCERAGECGHRSFTIMAGALDRLAVSAEQLSYEGTFGVGYGICAYEVLGADDGRNFLEQYEAEERERIERRRGKEDAYIQLARRTIEAFTRQKPGGHFSMELPDGLPDEMYSRKAGVFVSVKKNGRLRGCIGTIHPACECVAEEIVENAVGAASRDPRFLPVQEKELDKLVISVDVLGGTEKIGSPDELDVERYGVIVTKGHKRGLLLPNLEGVDTVEEQISIAKQKAGIGEWDEVGLERFEVIRHEVSE